MGDKLDKNCVCGVCVCVCVEGGGWKRLKSRTAWSGLHKSLGFHITLFRLENGCKFECQSKALHRCHSDLQVSPLFYCCIHYVLISGESRVIESTSSYIHIYIYVCIYLSIEHPPPPDRTLPYSYRKLSGYIFQLYIYLRVGTRFLKEFPKVLHKNKSFLPSLID